MVAAFSALVGVVVALAVTVAMGVAYGARRWEAGTWELRARLEAARAPMTTRHVDFRELEGLPAPVRRYLRAVLTDGQPVVAAVSVKHSGTFNMGEAAERWRPFASAQRVITRRPGFVWDARIRMAPGMTVFVHDAYALGDGILIAKLFGLLTVMDQPRTPELAHGELMRFFAEAAWYPTALLPSLGVHWEAIDDQQASAALTDGDTTVRLVVTFDEHGMISAVRSNARFRVVDGVPVATPWQGRFWDYVVRDGMLVPLEGEVAWLLPDGPKPYWRGRIVEIAYEFVE